MEGINDKVDRKTMGKVLQIAADSVALSSLQSVLLLSQGNKKTAGCKTVRCLRGRQTAIGRTFKITEKELKIMPEKYRNLFACQDRLVPYRFHKGVFEAHYRRHGMNVFACAKDFETMRRKFIEKLGKLRFRSIRIATAVGSGAKKRIIYGLCQRVAGSKETGRKTFDL